MLRSRTGLKMSQKADSAKEKKKDQKTFRLKKKLEELLLKTSLKMSRKSGSLTANYKEVRHDSRIVHSIVNV